MKKIFLAALCLAAFHSTALAADASLKTLKEKGKLVLGLDDSFLFDEPTSALDPELTGEILTVIRALAAEKMTMVVVTHEMGFARDVADRAMLIDAGVIVEEGNARELIDNPRNERTRAFLKRFSQTSKT